ncbi:MAG TPA: family 10 glycosylhydrolase [Gemmatimonadaceae bacterium]|nr:family 10 glycosylhydrolase [Gemmatimonadaceae bacterium]
MRAPPRLRFLAPVVALSLASTLSAQPASSSDAPPPVAREFRASWVATVANIDWPSRPGLSSWEQQAELRAIMDRAARLKMNAVVFQVRPAADALYASPHEPWSEYLTGVQGLPPDPYYDPLELAVKEAHARGLELHAWFNPYRAKHPTARSDVAATHVAKTRPALVRTYGRHLWLDPGLPEVRRYSLAVVTDVVRRYDVDGVHIDDYFYPYKERDAANAVIDFPDSVSYARYRAGGGTLGKDDWRRENVNQFVRELYAEVKRLKPHVKVGVSPIGLYRPGQPASVTTGFDSYAEIYGDSRLWWRNGWVDYFAPQLYWLIEPPRFAPVFDWWREENVKQRHLWIGLFTSRVGGTGTPTWPAREIVDQITLLRERRDSLASGHIHFSERGLRTARENAAAVALAPADTGGPPSAGRQDTLRLLGARRDSMIAAVAQLYAEPALVPASPWLDRTPPAAPTASLARHAATGGAVLQVRPAMAADVRVWVVQSRTSAGWRTQIRPGWERDIVLGERPLEVHVRAVDRVGNESRRVVVR